MVIVPRRALAQVRSSPAGSCDLLPPPVSACVGDALHPLRFVEHFPDNEIAYALVTGMFNHTTWVSDDRVGPALARPDRASVPPDLSLGRQDQRQVSACTRFCSSSACA